MIKSPWQQARRAALGVAAMSLLLPVASAQQTNESNAGNRATEEIVVTGIRASIEDAINRKRMANQMIDAISAEDIGKLPDENIGEALQRITGISLGREAGEGKEISIRGLGAGLSQVTVNGQKIVGTQGDRSFNFSVLDSSLVSALEVWKSPTASQDEGAVGGTVNIVTRGPLDRNGTVVNLRAGGQYEDLSGEWGEKHNASISTANDAGTLGISVSGNFSNRLTRADQVVIPGWALEDPTTNDWSSRGWDQLAAANGLDFVLYPRDLSSRVRYYDRSRYGMDTTVQWRPTDRLDIRVDGFWSELEDYDRNQSFQVRIRDLVSGGGRDVNDYVWAFDGNDAIFFDTAGANLRNGWRGLRNIATQRDNTWSSYGANFVIDYALSDQRTLALQFGKNRGEGDQLTYPIVQFRESTGFAVDFRDDRRFPTGTVEDGYTLDQLEFQVLNINDQLDDQVASFIQLDFENGLSGEHVSAIKAGIKLRDEELSRWQVRDTGNSGLSGTLDDYVLVCGDAPCSASNHTYVGDTLAPFNGTFEQVDFTLLHADFPRDSRGQTVSYNESWKVEESTIAAYVQADLEGELFGLPYRGNAGLRYFRTELTSSGWLDTDGAQRGVVDRSYSDLLPSLNLSLVLEEDLLLRIGASRVIARPDQEDFSFGGSFNIVDQTARVGNPNLDPFEATALDVAIEWYFAEAGLLSGALFYKDVDSFVSNGEIAEPIVIVTPDGTLEFDAVGPINGDGAKIKGVEFGYQHAFDFLPAPFDGLGGQFNYTYTDSTVNIPYTEGSMSFNMPLEGLSKSSYNAILYYERDRFSARLAYNWRDHFLSNRANPQGNPVFTDDYGQLDISFSYDVTDRVSVSLAGVNVNEEARFQYFLTPNRLLAHRASGSRYSATLRARF